MLSGLPSLTQHWQKFRRAGPRCPQVRRQHLRSEGKTEGAVSASSRTRRKRSKCPLCVVRKGGCHAPMSIRTPSCQILRRSSATSSFRFSQVHKPTIPTLCNYKTSKLFTHVSTRSVTHSALIYWLSTQALTSAHCNLPEEISLLQRQNQATDGKSGRTHTRLYSLRKRRKKEYKQPSYNVQQLLNNLITLQTQVGSVTLYLVADNIYVDINISG